MFLLSLTNISYILGKAQYIYKIVIYEVNNLVASKV